MTYEMRETPEQLAAEAADLATFASFTGSAWEKLYAQKYKLDAVMLRDGQVAAWVEHKTSGNDYGCLLNASKAAAGVEHARTSKLPFILLARHDGKLLYCTVYNILGDTNWQNILHKKEVKLIWQIDTRPGHDNPDDDEPCWVIPWQMFKVIK